MKNIKYWQGFYIETAVLENLRSIPLLFSLFKNCLYKFINNHYYAAGLDKKNTIQKDYSLYTFRLNREHRLLFTTHKVDGVSYALQLKLIEEHAYDQCMELKDPKVTKKIISDFDKENYTLINEDTIADILGEEFPDAEAQESLSVETWDFFSSKAISFTTEQNEIYTKNLPLMITGGPGSGKTCTAIKMLYEWYLGALFEDAAIAMYITFSPRLMRTAQSIWDNLTLDPMNPRKVVFMTFLEYLYQHDAQFSESFNKLIKHANTLRKNAKLPLITEDQEEREKEQEDAGYKIEDSIRIFSDWLHRDYFKKNPKSSVKKYDVIDIFTEMTLILGCAKEQDYQNIGKHPLLLNKDLRPQCWQIAKQYSAYLEFKKWQDPFFYCKKLFTAYPNHVFLVIDEIQDWYKAQLDAVFDPKIHKQLVVLGDSHQQCQKGLPIIALLKNELKLDESNILNLNCSHRCSAKVLGLFEKFLQSKIRIASGVEEKNQYIELKPASTQVQEGVLGLLEIKKLEPKNIHAQLEYQNVPLEEMALFDSYKQSADFVVLTSERYKDLAISLFGKGCVCTVEEYKGLESRVVALFNLFEDKDLLGVTALLRQEQRPLKTNLSKNKEFNSSDDLTKVKSFLIAVSRSSDALFILNHKSKHPAALIHLVQQWVDEINNGAPTVVFEEPRIKNSKQDYIEHIDKLIAAGLTEQAEDIFNKHIRENWLTYLRSRKSSSILAVNAIQPAQQSLALTSQRASKMGVKIASQSTNRVKGNQLHAMSREEIQKLFNLPDLEFSKELFTTIVTVKHPEPKNNHNHSYSDLTKDNLFNYLLVKKLKQFNEAIKNISPNKVQLIADYLCNIWRYDQRLGIPEAKAFYGYPIQTIYAASPPDRDFFVELYEANNNFYLQNADQLLRALVSKVSGMESEEDREQKDIEYSTVFFHISRKSKIEQRCAILVKLLNKATPETRKFFIEQLFERTYWTIGIPEQGEIVEEHSVEISLFVTLMSTFDGLKGLKKLLTAVENFDVPINFLSQYIVFKQFSTNNLLPVLTGWQILICNRMPREQLDCYTEILLILFQKSAEIVDVKFSELLKTPVDQQLVVRILQAFLQYPPVIKILEAVFKRMPSLYNHFTLDCWGLVKNETSPFELLCSATSVNQQDETLLKKLCFTPPNGELHKLFPILLGVKLEAFKDFQNYQHLRVFLKYTLRELNFLAILKAYLDKINFTSWDKEFNHLMFFLTNFFSFRNQGDLGIFYNSSIFQLKIKVDESFNPYFFQLITVLNEFFDKIPLESSQQNRMRLVKMWQMMMEDFLKMPTHNGIEQIWIKKMVRYLINHICKDDNELLSKISPRWFEPLFIHELQNVLFSPPEGEVESNADICMKSKNGRLWLAGIKRIEGCSIIKQWEAFDLSEAEQHLNQPAVKR